MIILIHPLLPLLSPLLPKKEKEIHPLKLVVLRTITKNHSLMVKLNSFITGNIAIMTPLTLLPSSMNQDLTLKLENGLKMLLKSIWIGSRLKPYYV